MGTVMVLPYQNLEILSAEYFIKNGRSMTDDGTDAPALNEDLEKSVRLDDSIPDPASELVAGAKEKYLKTSSPFYRPEQLIAVPLRKAKSFQKGQVVEMNGKQKWTYHYVGGQVVASMVQDPELDGSVYFDGHGQEISADKHAKLLTELAQKDESVELAAAMPAEFQKILGLSDLEKLDF